MKNRKELSGNEEGREGRVGNRISELKEEGRREELNLHVKWMQQSCDEKGNSGERWKGNSNERLHAKDQRERKDGCL